ncbi:MAG: ParB/RepB/Spo0J family partition protein [Gammaproteobacteria bacterium]|nr:ParB/RepB/Spo0J family partition protein [Gammaproteobacteria bacterium]
MAAKKKKTAKRKVAKRKKTTRSRAKIAPRKEKRGLKADEIVLDIEFKGISALVDEVNAAGGAAIGAYREPLSGRPVLVAVLPINAVQPTPFQRDLSPTHTKRLSEKIEESGSFLDPIIVVRGQDGDLWTPNGRHRLAAAKHLGLRQITALISPNEDLAFRILALNTEKAHNVKDRSLEVIRMARNLAERRPRAKESQYHEEFEAPELLTLGVIYERNKRFAGGAYAPFLKKIDRFTDRTLPVSIRQREDYAARLEEIDAQVKKIIEKLKARGFQSPYLRNYVVARINPVRFHRAKRGDTKPPMTMAAALTRMSVAAKKFDVKSVKFGDLAMVAAVSGSAD